MKRRRFLALPGAVLFTGCTGFLSEEKTLGDTKSFGHIDVTVNDSMTASQITVNGDKLTAPENGIYALFSVETHNTDSRYREIPHVNPEYYETIEKEDGVIYTGDINDIRVYGSGEAGHFLDLDGYEERVVESGHFGLVVDGEELKSYPVGKIRPTLNANSTVSGWVVGIINAGATPELRVNFDGRSKTWTTD